MGELSDAERYVLTVASEEEGAMFGELARIPGESQPRPELAQAIVLDFFERGLVEISEEVTFDALTHDERRQSGQILREAFHGRSEALDDLPDRLRQRRPLSGDEVRSIIRDISNWSFASTGVTYHAYATDMGLAALPWPE